MHQAQTSDLLQGRPFYLECPALLHLENVLWWIGEECLWGQGSGPWPLGGAERHCSTWPCPWLTQDSDYVVAVRNFLPEDPSLLAFHKGDIIHLQPLEPPRIGRCLGMEWV